MTFAPVIRFADHLEMARENSAPANPMTAEKINNARKFSCVPYSANGDSIPSSRITIERITSIAMLVARNGRIRFIATPLLSLYYVSLQLGN